MYYFCLVILPQNTWAPPISSERWRRISPTGFLHVIQQQGERQDFLPHKTAFRTQLDSCRASCADITCLGAIAGPPRAEVSLLDRARHSPFGEPCMKTGERNREENDHLLSPRKCANLDHMVLPQHGLGWAAKYFLYGSLVKFSKQC